MTGEGAFTSVLFDHDKCVACVACTQACPTRAIRVRDSRVALRGDLCISCGECIRACPHDAVSAWTSSPSDLKRFDFTVAIPSTTLFSQFGPDVEPGRVLRALGSLGFDAAFDMTWMCEMVGGAVDTFLSECEDPWPKISATCPAIIRLIQIRYPDLLPHLVPVETPRELAAKWARRKYAAERRMPPDRIGVFYITPCSAIMQSIVAPVGLEESYLDGAFSVSEIYGPLRQALREGDGAEASSRFSGRGLGWAIAGGETSTLRNANTLAVSGVGDVTYVFDRIESGKFRSVDYLEAYICPDGCVSGPLLVEGRWAAKRTVREIARRFPARGGIQEEKVRELFRAHFFDLEEEIKARAVKPLAKDLGQAVRLHREREALLARLPRKDCAACGAPNCETLAADVTAGEASIDDCVFVRLERLGGHPGAGGGAAGVGS